MTHPTPTRTNRRRALALLALTLSMATATAMAQQNIGNMANNLLSQLGSVADVVLALAFIAGLAFFTMGAVSLYQHGKNPDHNPMKKVVILFIAGALLVGLPSAILMTQASLGVSGSHTSTSAGQANNIQ